MYVVINRGKSRQRLGLLSRPTELSGRWKSLNIGFLKLRSVLDAPACMLCRSGIGLLSAKSQSGKSCRDMTSKDGIVGHSKSGPGRAEAPEKGLRPALTRRRHLIKQGVACVYRNMSLGQGPAGALLTHAGGRARVG